MLLSIATIVARHPLQGDPFVSRAVKHFIGMSSYHSLVFLYREADVLIVVRVSRGSIPLSNFFRD